MSLEYAMRLIRGIKTMGQECILNGLVVQTCHLNARLKILYKLRSKKATRNLRGVDVGTSMWRHNHFSR